MIKAIENIFKSILRFLFRVGRQLSEYASANPRPQEAIVSAASESAPGDSPVEIPPPLAPEPPIILIECTSCGELVKLTGVCQSCGRPVCKEGFCRRTVYREDLGISVIQCRNCAPAA